MIDKQKLIVLLNFLKSGLSTREIDKLLGHSNTRGWVSWDILKKYKLRNFDKGKLFLYSTRQSNEIITKIIEGCNEGLIDLLIKKIPPANIEKYKNTYVIADSEKSYYSIMSGETRNIIRDFFNPEKKLIGKCQFKDCNARDSQIDTVHFIKDRPQIFMECAEKNKTREKNDFFRFDVHKTMKCFILSHSKPKSVCFLCKKHHNEFHRAENKGKKALNDFKRKVMF